MPSREDLRLTLQLVDAGKLLDIRVHDHVIIGDGNQDAGPSATGTLDVIDAARQCGHSYFLLCGTHA